MTLIKQEPEIMASVEALEREMREIRSSVSELSSLISEGLAPKRGGGSEDPSQRTDPTHRIGTEEFKQLFEFVEAYTKKNPSKAMTLATAAGFVVGLVFSKGRRS